MTRLVLLLVVVAGCHAGLDSPSDLGATTDGAKTACASLDEQGCKQRSECVVDWCPLCGCSIGFGACRAPGDPVIAKCPGLGCSSGRCCRTDSDCGSDAGCGAQPRSCCRSGVQACILDACKVDADCAGNGGHPGICEPVAYVEGTGHRCEVGCLSDSECGAGSACTNSRCALAPCGTCPVDFTCESGLCVANPCSTDKDCSQGVCTFGQCSESLGWCAPNAQQCSMQN